MIAGAAAAAAQAWVTRFSNLTFSKIKWNTTIFDFTICAVFLFRFVSWEQKVHGRIRNLDLSIEILSLNVRSVSHESMQFDATIK